MKKFCFYLFIFIAIALFVLFSCAEADNLYDVLLSVTAADESLPAGKILCYGAFYENSVSDDTISSFLGLEGYPQFKEKIEDFAVYSTLSGDYSEIAAMRLYSSSDVKDAELFFERRIKSVKRALNTSKKSGYADSAYIKAYGNTVVLYMMENNEHYESEIKKAM